MYDSDNISAMIFIYRQKRFCEGKGNACGLVAAQEDLLLKHSHSYYVYALLNHWLFCGKEVGLLCWLIKYCGSRRQIR